MMKSYIPRNSVLDDTQSYIPHQQSKTIAEQLYFPSPFAKKQGRIVENLYIPAKPNRKREP